MAKEKSPKEILSSMTLEEKAAMLTGADVWHTVEHSEHGLPAITMSDGPNGVRKEGAETLCFPSACALACSFDAEAVHRAGRLLGEEANANGVDLILAPSINIKRSPLCGRNFEYYSEDPYLTGELAGEFARGIEENAGSCLKHFAANNREKLRMVSDSVVSMRALNDIYLEGFRRAVSKASPMAVMSSYNKINGCYAGQNKWLLTDVLRGEWGYDGFVVSDWGAVDEAAVSVEAGLDLEMPSNKSDTQKIISAVKSGALSEAAVDRAALRIIKAAQKAKARVRRKADLNAHAAALSDIAAGCCVLLKNDGGLLPFEKGASVAVFGRGAVQPRLQGGGSANVSLPSAARPLDALSKRFSVTCYDGSDLKKVAEIAQNNDVCLVFAGLGEEEESEGYDRADLSFPAAQTALIEAACRANPSTAVILTQGGVTELPWKDKPKAILLTYLLGSVYGEAVARIVSGEAEPSGRLAESWVEKFDDCSCRPYETDGAVCEYGEGVFVGYRLYSTVNRPVAYPFGFGLGYTAFELSGAEFTADGERVKVSVSVANTGKRRGSEVVQIYMSVKDGETAHPSAELAGFAKVTLQPGESKRVTVEIDRDALMRYDMSAKKRVHVSRCELSVRTDANTVIFSETLDFCEKKATFDRNTLVGTVLRERPELADFLKPYLCYAILGNFNAKVEIKNGEAVGDKFFTNVMNTLPLRALYNITGGAFTQEMIDGIINPARPVKQ